MTRFVMRDGHMVSTERAALLDAAGGDASAIPTPEPAAEPVRIEQIPSQATEALTRAQKAAATRSANKAAKDAALLAAKAAKIEPLRPQNIDADGNPVILKEVLAEDGKTILQVPVEVAPDADLAPDEFDALVDAAAAEAQPVDESGADPETVDESALADA